MRHKTRRQIEQVRWFLRKELTKGQQPWTEEEDNCLKENYPLCVPEFSVSQMSSLSEKVWTFDKKRHHVGKFWLLPAGTLTTLCVLSFWIPNYLRQAGVHQSRRVWVKSQHTSSVKWFVYVCRFAADWLSWAWLVSKATLCHGDIPKGPTRNSRWHFDRHWICMES